MRTRSLLVLLLLVTGLAAGCGGDDTSPSPFSLSEILRRVEERTTPRPVAQPEGGVPEETPIETSPDPRPSTSEDVESTYRQYRAFTQTVVDRLNEYWDATLPSTFGVSYSGPRGGVIAYDPQDPSTFATCGGERVGPPGNAFYCRAGEDLIAFDEPNLVFRVFVETGDAASAAIIAHEWGHLVQQRLRKEGTTFQLEVNADCLAGAWFQWMKGKGQLEQGDLDEVIKQLYDVRDARNTRWEANDGHGNGFERVRSFTRGFEEGVRSCDRLERDPGSPAATTTGASGVPAG